MAALTWLMSKVRRNAGTKGFIRCGTEGEKKENNVKEGEGRHLKM